MILVPPEVKVVSSASAESVEAESVSEAMVEMMVDPPEVKVVRTGPPRISLMVLVTSSPSELVKTLV
jgi:hypothetical protein